MVKRLTSFGSSETDALVIRYLARKGIDHRDVFAYKIERDARDRSVITLEVLFSDEPAGVEVTGLDTAEPERMPGRVTPINPHVIRSDQYVSGQSQV